MFILSPFQRFSDESTPEYHFALLRLGDRERIDAANKVCGARLRKTSALAALKRKIAQCEHT